MSFLVWKVAAAAGRDAVPGGMDAWAVLQGKVVLQEVSPGCVDSPEIDSCDVHPGSVLLDSFLWSTYKNPTGIFL